MNQSARILLFCLIGAAAAALFRCTFGRQGSGSHGNITRTKVETNLENVFKADQLVDVAVIGSGVAGLSAGMYGGRFKLHTVIFSGKLPGGQLTETSYVENWPGFKKELGVDLIKNLKTQAESFGALYVNDSVVSINTKTWPYTIKTQEGLSVHALSIVIATGAEPRRLNVAGESAYWGKGVSSCAICDAPFFKDKDVGVVGGGDSAIEEATQLAMAGARSVVMLVRGEKMRAAKTMQERLAAFKTISVRYNVSIKEILGNGSEVTGLTLVSKKDGKEVVEQMPIHGLFLAIGHVPNTHWLRGVVEMDSEGYILTEKRTQKTNVPGIFVAGEAEDYEYRQAAVEAGRGVCAMIDASRFLSEVGLNDEISKKLESKRFVPGKTRAGSIIKVKTVKEFETVIKENKRVLVDFYTRSCPSCVAMLPHLEAYAAEKAEEIMVIKVDADQIPELAARSRFNINAVPTLVLISDGAEKRRSVGGLDKKSITQFVEASIKA